jgi:hypothetical protein
MGAEGLGWGLDRALRTKPRTIERAIDPPIAIPAMALELSLCDPVDAGVDNGYEVAEPKLWVDEGS